MTRGKGLKALQTTYYYLLCICHTVLIRLSHGEWGDIPRRYARDGHPSSAGGSVRRSPLPSPMHAGTAEPLRVSPPEAVAYPLDLNSLERRHSLGP